MPKTIVWFQDDLRLSDHPALWAACKRGEVIPVYILDESYKGCRPLGGASRWWLHHSLKSLEKSLGELVLRKGDALEHLQEIAKTYGADAIYCSKSFNPLQRGRDQKIADFFGASFQTFPGTLLFEPQAVKNKQGLPFKVFTPFWKECLRREITGGCLQKPDNIKITPDVNSNQLEDWSLLPTKPDWSKGLQQAWKPGEDEAHRLLTSFLADKVYNYKEGRDFPAIECTSRLSPYLRFGEISPKQVWMAAAAAGDDKNIVHFMQELVWREFSYNLICNFPYMIEAPFNKKFESFPWQPNEKFLQAWQLGKMGYPIADAGMRELWQTGYMHNRVRMIVGSLLTKHMLIHWKQGEEWFWDTLVDADIASNVANWQWVAGSGADAQPYFRIFNPILQGKKFDPEGKYVRKWVPEVVNLSNDKIHAPWEAGMPKPVVPHEEGRERALQAYEHIK
ncbi:MAG: cryptochrome/photolyase family protein [Alphaproteobacteria bacterium]